MKKTLLLLTLVSLVAPAAFGSVASPHIAVNQAAQTPEQVTREFYKWHLRALNQNKDPLKQRETLSRYVTARRLQEIRRQVRAGEYVADFFISAQDWDKDWEKNINVSDAKIQNGRATLNVLLTGAEIQKHKLRVTLRKENGIWKIDEVQGADD